MTILALYSMKGGVGKTAAAVNLAYEAALSGHQTLLCDLDPQGAASFYFRIRAKQKFGKKQFLKGGKRVAQNIRGTDFERLDMLPSAMSFRNLDLALGDRKRSTRRLSQVLDSVQGDYQYAFLDCPPNITLLAENVFHAAHRVVVPCIPTTLSMLAFEKLVEFFEKNRLDRRKLLPFFSMVERRKTMHRDTVAHARRENAFLNTEITYLSDVERMGLAREPVACFKPRSAAVRAYRALWLELCDHLEGV